MGEEKTGNPEKDAKNIIPPSATAEYVDEPVSDTPNPQPQTDYGGKKNNEPVQVIVNLPAENKRPQIIANWIAIAGIVVSIVLGYITYLLFLKTVEANKTSKDSLIVAQQALESSRITDSINRIDDRIRDSLDSVQRGFDFNRDTINIKLSKQSLDAQIMAIKETQRQFEIANEPFLEIDSAKIKIVIGQPLSFTYQIKNLNNYTAQIIGGITIISVRHNVPDIRKVEVAPGSVGLLNSLVSKYVAPGNPLWSSTDDSPTIFDATKADKYQKGQYFIYFGGVNVYKNMVTGKKRIYRYLVKYAAGMEAELIVNDNEPFKEKKKPN